jgi:hypothetical protein
MKTAEVLLALFDEAYQKKAWHGPNLKQSLKGVTAKQAAWRPGKNRHNIWELALHAAYWKYTVRNKLDGGKRGSFVLKGSNFFARPEKRKLNEKAWKSDKEILEREHQALRRTLTKTLQKNADSRTLRMIYSIALHDVYHAGQIRLLRRLEGRR